MSTPENIYVSNIWYQVVIRNSRLNWDIIGTRSGIFFLWWSFMNTWTNKSLLEMDTFNKAPIYSCVSELCVFAFSYNVIS